jgi:dCMP deaminase
MERPNKIEWYLQIAKDIALRSPCISRRRFGAILVKDDAIISTGYAGTVRGAINCGIDCKCLKDLYNEKRNKSYEHCPSIHAEQNTIINGARTGVSILGSTLYLSETNDNGDRPCYLCRRFLINSGIEDCYYKKDNVVYHEFAKDWIKLEDEWINNQLNQ